MIVSAPTSYICPVGKQNLCITSIAENIDNPYDVSKMLIEIQFETKTLGGQKSIVTLRCSPVLHPQGHLLPLVEAALGRPLTAQEQLSFNLDLIIGKIVNGEVSHQASARGTVYARVGNFSKAVV